MKKLFLLFTFSFFLVEFSFTQSPAWLWGNNAIGNKDDASESVATDIYGNVYIIGYFYSPTISFGGFTLYNADITGNSDDIFFVKYDKNGVVQWAKSAGNSSYDIGKCVVADKYGNIYITGCYGNLPITFGSYTLNNNGSADVFLVKYDSNGNVLWAKSAVGSGSDDSRSVSVDLDGNIFIAGSFRSSSITFGTYTLNNVGSNDIFIAKYDSLGTVLWAKSAGGNDDDLGYNVATDIIGNVYLTGNFYSTSITFGSQLLYNTGGADVFLTKFNSYGNVLYEISSNGQATDVSTGLTCDYSGNVFLAGSFTSSELIFDNDTLENQNAQDIFLIKFSSIGNILWSKSYTSGEQGIITIASTINGGNGIATDKCGNLYATGGYTSSYISFGIDTLYNESDTIIGGEYYNDIFIVKFDSLGVIQFAKSTGGIHDDHSYYIGVDNDNNILLTGWTYSPKIAFGSDTITNSDLSTVTSDIFISKFEKSCLCNTAHAEKDTVICAGQYVQLFASGGTSFSWSPSTGLNEIHIFNPLAHPDSTTTYTVTVTNFGCTSIDSVTVFVNSLPFALAYQDTLVCHSVNDTLFATGGISYIWDNNCNTQSNIVNVYTTTTYTVTVTDINGCTASDDVTIIVDSLPLITISNDTNISVLTCDQLFDSYQWYLDGLEINGATNQSYYPLENGIYTVSVSDSFGCSAISEQFFYTIVGITSFDVRSNFEIIPNPATNSIQITAPKKSKINILNIEGQILKSFISFNDITTHDISDLSRGMYFITAKTEDGISTQKFIKD